MVAVLAATTSVLEFELVPLSRKCVWVSSDECHLSCSVFQVSDAFGCNGRHKLLIVAAAAPLSDSNTRGLWLN